MGPDTKRIDLNGAGLEESGYSHFSIDPGVLNRYRAGINSLDFVPNGSLRSAIMELVQSALTSVVSNRKDDLLELCRTTDIPRASNLVYSVVIPADKEKISIIDVLNSTGVYREMLRFYDGYVISDFKLRQGTLESEYCINIDTLPPFENVVDMFCDVLA